jgi:cell division protein FtsW (lipid II flippase)
MKALARSDKTLAFAGLIAALIVALPTMIEGNDFGAFVLSGLILFFVGLTLIVLLFANLRRRTTGALLMIGMFVICTPIFFKCANPVRNKSRWLTQSRSYKSAVLAQPISPRGELKHVEWDGWGGPGAGDTTVYLVFDPNNSLSSRIKPNSDSIPPGIPCKVFKINRLESQWYTVQFYTDTAWNYCG